MALETKLKLRSVNFYQVYLKQHPEEGTISSLIKDLPRIKSLGMNYIYLMPIFETGKDAKSPYFIKNIREIDSKYGTLKDFKLLIKEANKLDLKIVLDIVFTGTSSDALIYQENPEWYLRENLLDRTKTSDNKKVKQFDYSNEELQKYLVETLLFWADLGVSGFRFDSAALIPLSFWLKTRKAVLKRYDQIVFIGQSFNLEDIKDYRDKNINVLSDGELYQAFDILYDNDIYKEFNAYINNHEKLNFWLEAIYKQESLYPKNFIKLRNLEDHQSKRIAEVFNSPEKLLNITALLAFLKGSMLIYAGQEYGIKKKIDLSDNKKIDLTEKDKELTNLLHRISHLRKDSLFQTGIFKIHLQNCEVAVISYENEMSIAYGIFNLGNSSEEISLDLNDGIYQNILYPNQIKIINKKLKLSEKPMILFAMKKQI